MNARTWLALGSMACWIAVSAWSAVSLRAQEKEAPKASAKDAAAKDTAKGEAVTVSLAEGRATMIAPKEWTKKEPASRIVEHEFAVKAVEGDKEDGRFTVMTAGGGVEANVDRWIGQFTQPDKRPTREVTKIDKQTINGLEVHIVDISGTYKDQRGPMSPTVNRPDYRMLAAVVVFKKGDRSVESFAKLYGPKKTIATQEKAFKAMLESLQPGK